MQPDTLKLGYNELPGTDKICSLKPGFVIIYVVNSFGTKIFVHYKRVLLLLSLRKSFLRILLFSEIFHSLEPGIIILS